MRAGDPSPSSSSLSSSSSSISPPPTPSPTYRSWGWILCRVYIKLTARMKDVR
jgi:hypothetical protein